MDKRQFSTIFILVVVAVSLLVIFTSVLSRGQTPKIPAMAEEQLIPSPTPGRESTIEYLAPNGKMTLILKETIKSGGIEYVFLVEDSNGVQKLVYSTSMPAGSSFGVSYNTFSPDNKYFFLVKNTADEADYLVISAKEVSDSIDVKPLFSEKYPDFKIAEVTGWGGINLLLINTDKLDGSVGPSFWFDVPSRSFIRLSTRFN